MPKYVKFLMFICFLLWGWWVYLLFFGISPDSYREIFLFLGVLFFALGLTFSFIFYFIYLKKYPNFVDMRVLFRRGLKWGFFVSFGVIGAAFLKALNLINVLNAGLFGLLYLATFIQLRGRG
jgi:hypothetical protein